MQGLAQVRANELAKKIDLIEATAAATFRSDEPSAELVLRALICLVDCALVQATSPEQRERLCNLRDDIGRAMRWLGGGRSSQ